MSEKSARSKADTKKLYKKLTSLGGMQASLISIKRDYATLENI